jgi:transposase
MENDALFKTLLNLPGVEILEVRVNREGHCLIRVESVGDRTRCHICGKEIHHSYGYDRDIKLRHWPIFDRESYIVLRPKRYQCLRCHGRPTTTERLSWYEPKRPHTKAYEERILLLLINSTVEDVSLKEGIGYDAVSGVMASHIDAEIDWQEVKGLKVIGIDEISLKKGHKDFVTIVTALVGTQMRILGVLGDRKKATVKAFFSGIPKRIRKTLRTVCCDMYDGFVNAAKEVFGSKVKVVADRFHVAKLYRGG